jgi:hypothetical protein
LTLIDRRTQKDLPLDEPVLEYYSDIRSGGADDLFLIDLHDDNFQTFLIKQSKDSGRAVAMAPSETEANEPSFALVDVEAQAPQPLSKSVDLEGVDVHDVPPCILAAFSGCLVVGLRRVVADIHTLLRQLYFRRGTVVYVTDSTRPASSLRTFRRIT